MEIKSIQTVLGPRKCLINAKYSLNFIHFKNNHHGTKNVNECMAVKA